MLDSAIVDSQESMSVSVNHLCNATRDHPLGNRVSFSVRVSFPVAFFHGLSPVMRLTRKIVFSKYSSWSSWRYEIAFNVVVDCLHPCNTFIHEIIMTVDVSSGIAKQRQFKAWQSSERIHALQIIRLYTHSLVVFSRLELGSDKLN